MSFEDMQMQPINRLSFHAFLLHAQLQGSCMARYARRLLKGRAWARLVWYMQLTLENWAMRK